MTEKTAIDYWRHIVVTVLACVVCAAVAVDVLIYRLISLSGDFVVWVKEEYGIRVALALIVYLLISAAKMSPDYLFEIERLNSQYLDDRNSLREKHGYWKYSLWR